MAKNRKAIVAIIGAGVAIAGLSCMVSRNRKLAAEAAAGVKDGIKTVTGPAKRTKVNALPGGKAPKVKQKDTPEAAAIREQVRAKGFGKKPKGMSNKQWKKLKRQQEDQAVRRELNARAEPKA